MSLLSNIDEYDIRVGLSYYDHPVAAADDDGGANENSARLLIWLRCCLPYDHNMGGSDYAGGCDADCDGYD